jgi:hypothetical protein
MVQTDGMSHFVDKNAPDFANRVSVTAKPQTAAIRVPVLGFVEQDVGLSRCTISCHPAGDGQGVGAE